jgi:hypothetical protein
MLLPFERDGSRTVPLRALIDFAAHPDGRQQM